MTSIRARELQAPAIEAATGVNAALLACLSKEERRQFLTLMQKIIAAQSPESGG